MEFKLKQWGWYLTLIKGRYFKLKFLYFKPGGEISLQRHYKREEVWCFIFGDGVFSNYKNHSSRIRMNLKTGRYNRVPRMNWHHYKANKRTLVLELQTGVCNENDIERHND